ncbi:Up in starvation [Coemansia sp. RSA 2322]|nr:Up in starvation [Coemansia sp. RSA 2322]
MPDKPSVDCGDNSDRFGVSRSSIFFSSDRHVPAGMPRRSSITSVASSTVSNNHSDDTPHMAQAAMHLHADDMQVGAVASLKRARRESIGSSNSVLSGEHMIGGSGSSERKYMCDWHGCGQAFDRVEHLNRHKRRHTGEKPYRCLVSKCTKLFSRFDNMMQHVGIHNVEGLKTEIPNIKNLSIKGRGRGRARRTSYRGSQDPHEKFRRHVEIALGYSLARCCVLPTEDPDFSNLTLRPLLNTDAGGSIPTTIDEEDAPLSSSYGFQAEQPMIKRPRYDSVVDGMDRPSMMAASRGSVGSDSSDTMSPPTRPQVNQIQPAAGVKNSLNGSPRIQHRSMQPSPVRYASIPDKYYGAQQQQGYYYRRPTFPPQLPSLPTSASSMHRSSLGALPSAIRTSNVRSQPEYRRD